MKEDEKASNQKEHKLKGGYSIDLFILAFDLKPLPCTFHSF